MCPGGWPTAWKHALQAGKLYLISANCQGAKLCDGSPKLPLDKAFGGSTSAKVLLLRLAVCAKSLSE